MRPKSGGAQGDKVMPEQFRREYEDSLEHWMITKDSDLATSIHAIDPHIATDVDVSVTGYADDVKEINLTTSAKDVVHTIARSGVLLDQHIAHATLGQNNSKAEHIDSFAGLRQDANTKELTGLLDEHGLGSLGPCARYLGAWPTHNGSNGILIDKRIRADKEGLLWAGGTSMERAHIVEDQAHGLQ